jgi:hypothetical protein
MPANERRRMRGVSEPERLSSLEEAQDHWEWITARDCTHQIDFRVHELSGEDGVQMGGNK